MCTLALLPRPGGLLLGHNRDESRARGAARPPRSTRERGLAWLAPQDPDAGGTWIGVNEAGMVLALLNAAHGRPEALPPVPRSRGLLVRDLLPLATPEEVDSALERIDLSTTRGFRLLAVEPGRPAHLHSWDGLDRTAERREGPLLVTSSSFPSWESVERARRDQWTTFLEGVPTIPGLEAWLAGHAPERGPHSVCMHREEAGTVSRTLVEVDSERAVVRYTAGPPCEPSSPLSLHVLPLIGGPA